MRQSRPVRFRSSPALLCFTLALGCQGVIEGGGPGVSPSTPTKPTPDQPDMMPRLPGDRPPGMMTQPPAKVTDPIVAIAGMDPPSAKAPAMTGAPSGRLRRLTNGEYRNTVRDLLGLNSSQLGPADGFLPDAKVALFENNLDFPAGQTITLDYMEAAEKLIADRVKHKLDSLTKCDFAKDGMGCARELATTFGKRALRRPLTTEEADAFVGLYADTVAAPGATFKDGVQAVVEAMLQTPDFLYHLETGEPAKATGGWIPLTNHELASRLSYMLWSSMPDAELLAAADAGKLQTRAGLRAEVERMLAMPRTGDGLMRFFRQWLNFGSSIEIYNNPLYGKARPFIQKEVEMLIREAVLAPGGKLTNLLTADYAFLNEPLGAVYGITGLTGDAMVKTPVDPKERAGVLTNPIFLANTSHADGSIRPVIRGKFVRQRFLCQETPPPPPEADLMAPKLGGSLSVRQRFSQHAKDQFCAGCHRLMDPIGLAFNRYQATGFYKKPDPAKPGPDGNDEDGELFATDVDGKFNGVRQLAERLAKSADVQRCLPLQWYRYAMGTDGEAPEDHGSIEALVEAFKGNGDLRSLVVAITQTDAFRFVPAAKSEACK